MRVVKWSEHSYDVISQTRACEQMIVDCQSEVRGYLLNADPSFQASFNRQHIQVDQAFQQLENLVHDNPQQFSLAHGLVQAKDLWVSYATVSIEQRARGTSATPDWLRMGDNLMGNLRVQFQSFTQAEEGLHEKRIHHADTVKRVLEFAGGALFIILAVTVGALVRRQFFRLAVDYRTARDTIEHRHAALVRSEADLEEQKEWFRVTLTSIGDGVIVTDQEGRVVFMNQEAERLTNWNSVEALLKPISIVFRIVHETTRARIEDPVARVFAEKKIVGLKNQAVLVSRTGEEWPVEDSAAPIYDAKQKLLGVVLVFHDASEIRRAQNALRMHSEELERRVNQRTIALQQTVLELESFSYTVSHDLRSPLRAMMGFAQAVLEDYGDRLDEQGKNYLGRITNAAERLDRLIQDLLSYTRMSRQDAPLVPLDMDKMLRNIVQHYPNLNPPAAEIEIKGTLPHVLGQEASLTQVISNLLGNAAKFVPPGATPRIQVWSEDLGAQVRLWIEDNGIGIAPADYERIFKMFVQVNENRPYGGTGVGLAIVKKAVESMRGRVGLEPGKTGGTRFWVELSKAHDERRS